MKVKVYYNIHNDPDGPWEIKFADKKHDGIVNVKAIVSLVPLFSQFEPTNIWPEPKAWFEGDAVVTFSDDTAILHPIDKRD